MTKSKCTEEKILFALKQGDADQPIAHVCRQVVRGGICACSDDGGAATSVLSPNTVMRACALRDSSSSPASRRRHFPALSSPLAAIGSRRGFQFTGSAESPLPV